MGGEYVHGNDHGWYCNGGAADIAAAADGVVVFCLSLLESALSLSG